MNTNYQQTIDYLYSRLPMFSRIGAAAYKKDLHNTLELLQAIDNPHRKFKSIHIAGTNGKGSVSHLLAAVYQSNGYKTGLYTSPHLKDFRERIKINGAWIDEAFVIQFTESCKLLVDKIEPSFFELTVAMAFDWFAKNQVDIAIIETGLGGRLDSTNVITPELSIITNIGLEHTALLGSTLEAIAIEKAGIIKPHVPVVIGETVVETRAVFEAKSSQCNSPVFFAEEMFPHQTVEWLPSAISVTLFDNQQNSWRINSGLAGLYQQNNFRTVATAIRVLQTLGWRLQPTPIAEGLQHVQELTGFQGRWQTLQQQPLVILDVAHNPHGMQWVARQLGWIEQDFLQGTIRVVIGMVKDKDVEAVLKLLPTHYAYYFTQMDSPRTLNAAELKQIGEMQGKTGEAFNNVNLALQQALSECGENDMVIVCGSVFLVGEVDLAAIPPAQS